MTTDPFEDPTELDEYYKPGAIPVAPMDDTETAPIPLNDDNVPPF